MPKINYKKLLIILGFILVVFVFGFLLYYMFFRPVIAPPALPEEIIPEEGLPTAPPAEELPPEEIPEELPPEEIPEIIEVPVEPLASGTRTLTTTLVDKNTLGITLTSDGDRAQFYNEEDGKFYYVDKDGKIRLLSDKTFYQVQSVTWSPDKEKVVLEYPDETKIVYDFDSDTQYSMPKHWKDFSFSPTSSEMVAKSIGMDRENRWIITTSIDGNRATRIEPIGEEDANVHVGWSPNNQIVALYNEGKDFDRQTVYPIGLHGENFKSMIIEGRDYRPTWSEEGNTLLYSIYRSGNGYRPELWIVDAVGENIGRNRRNLKLETWADKCNFYDNSTIYCAVPQKMENGYGWYPEATDEIPDSIYKINLKTGYTNVIAVPDEDVTIEELTVSKDGRTIYFTDRNTGEIKKIDLLP